MDKPDNDLTFPSPEKVIFHQFEVLDDEGVLAGFQFLFLKIAQYEPISFVGLFNGIIPGKIDCSPCIETDGPKLLRILARFYDFLGNGNRILISKQPCHFMDYAFCRCASFDEKAWTIARCSFSDDNPVGVEGRGENEKVGNALIGFKIVPVVYRTGEDATVVKFEPYRILHDFLGIQPISDKDHPEFKVLIFHDFQRIQG